MSIDTSTIDRIVAGVLTQLAAHGEDARGGRTTEEQRHRGIANIVVSPEATPTVEADATSITARVITADVLLESLSGQTQITVSQKAIVTPAAWDVARERGLEIVRRRSQLSAHLKCAAKPDVAMTTASSLLIVVRHTDSIDRLWEDVGNDWRRELLGCPDDAADLAVGAICRGDAKRTVILAEQTHRTACLANRNERIKAVAIGDAGDIRSIRKQLTANVWCIDPTGRSWFQLRNTFRAITEQ